MAEDIQGTCVLCGVEGQMILLKGDVPVCHDGPTCSQTIREQILTGQKRILPPASVAPDEFLINGLFLLQAQESDFVCISTQQSAWGAEAAQRIVNTIREYCARTNQNGLSVAVIPYGVQITVLEENQMKNLGWVRKGLIVMPGGG